MNAVPIVARQVPVPLRFAPVALALAGSASAWVVLFVAIPPAAQDFPLGDDWAFGRGALAFAGGQGIHYFHWASMPQLGQWLWACPFVWGLGAGNVVLRLSTILLSWIGIGSYYDLLRQEGFATQQAVFLAATLAWHPFFFLCQGTFMTDVPSLSFALLALALYCRALKSNRKGYLAAATAVAILSALTRQNTVVVPLAMAVLWWRSGRPGSRSAWTAALGLPVVFGVGIHLWFMQRMDIRPLSPVMPSLPVVLLFPFLVFHLAGLSALPPLLLNFHLRSWVAWTIGLSFMGILGVIVFLEGKALNVGWKNQLVFMYEGMFPYFYGMLGPYGPFSGALVAGEREILLDLNARLLVTALGCVAGAALFAQLPGGRWREWLSRPLILFSLLQVPLILVAPYIFDRYLIVLLPGMISLAGSALPVSRWRWPPAAAMLLVTGVLSVFLMHDWLAWNTARWELGRRALARPLDPSEIEGGFEWDGWFAPSANAEPVKKPGRLRQPLTFLWFPHVSGHYALSFSELPGTMTLDSEPYFAWLRMSEKRFFLVEEQPARAAAPPPTRPGSKR